MKNRLITRGAASVLLGAAALLAPAATVAQAAVLVSQDDASSPEAKGWATNDYAKAASDDVGADSNSVYTVYTREASADTDRYLHNKSGAAAGAVYSGTGSDIYRTQACVSLDFESDDCGSWTVR